MSDNVVQVKREDPAYLKKMVERFCEWTGMDKKEVRDPVRDLGGDLWTEVRKFQAKICNEIEERELDDEFKEWVKQEISKMWRNINEKQAIGIDKLGLTVARKIKETNDTPNLNTQSDGEEKE